MPATLPDPLIDNADPPAEWSAADAAGWMLTGAICAACVWAAGLLVCRWLHGTDITETPAVLVAETALIMAGAGAVIGLVTGALAALLLERTARAVVVWGLGAGAVAALGGATGASAADAARGVLHPVIASSLAFAVSGLLAGAGGYAWSRRKAGRCRHGAETPRGSWETRVATVWAFTGALGSAVGWLASLVLTDRLMGVNLCDGLAQDPGGLARLQAVLGVLAGLVGGGAVGYWSATRRGSADRGGAALRAAGVGMLVGMFGGVGSPQAVVAFAGVPPEVSSSLAWCAAGFLGGLAAYALSLRTAERPDDVEVEADDEEAPAQPAGGGAWLSPEPAPRRRNPRGVPWASVLRLLPPVAASLLALLGAALAAPSAALPLLAVGLLGLATTFTLAAQERRLRHLERRFRQEPEP
jgi:hypothetical protein